MRTTWVVLLAATLAACSKPDSKEAKAAKAFAKSAMTVLPAETTAVLGMSFGKLRASPLWKEFFDDVDARLLAKGREKIDFEQVKKLCGFNPLEAAETALLGVSGFEIDDAVVVIRGDWDADKVARCFTALRESKGGKPKATKEGDLLLLSDETKAGDDVVLGWVDARTIVVDLGAKNDKARVQKLLAGKSASPPEGLADLLGKPDQGAAMWFAAKLPEDAVPERAARQFGGAPKAAWGHVGFGKKIKVSVGVRFESGDVARSVATKVGMFTGMIKGEPKLKDVKIDVKSDGKDVLGSVEFPAALVRELVAERADAGDVTDEAPRKPSPF